MYSGKFRTNVWYHLPFMAEYSIGLDLGGTNLRAGAIDKSGKLLEKVSGATPLAAGREPVLKRRIRKLLARREEVLAFVEPRAVQGGGGAVVVLLEA